MQPKSGTSPRYSICICNYNMGDTLFESLESILSQISADFEVILVDDGSSDNSVEICAFLAKKYDSFRYFQLERDVHRLLGETRNISISKANGEWCIFHLDTDDFIGPYVKDFVKLVEVLSEGLNKDVLYSGQQIHMARRKFLLSRGPFLNIYRGEDRDLYFRLVRSGEWIVISHKRFIYRLNRSKRKLLVKTLRDLLDQSVTDLRTKSNPLQYLVESFTLIRSIGYKVVLFRLLTIYWAWKQATSRGFLIKENYPSQEEFVKYRSENTKTSKEWLRLVGSSEHIGIDAEIFY